MSEMRLPLDFLRHPDGGFHAHCDHHAAWRWRSDVLDENAIEQAKKSLKRHHSRNMSIGVMFHGCLPGGNVPVEDGQVWP